MNKHLRFLSLLCGIAALLVSTGAKAVNYDDKVYTLNGRTYINEGDKHYVIVGENLVTDGDFSQINMSTGVIEGWCMGYSTVENGVTVNHNYELPAIFSETGASLNTTSAGLTYLILKDGGSGSSNTIGQAVKNLKPGHKYVFLCQSYGSREKNSNYGVFMMESETMDYSVNNQSQHYAYVAGPEYTYREQTVTDEDGNETTEIVEHQEWVQTATVFTAEEIDGYCGAGIKFAWAGDLHIGDIQLCEVEDVIYAGDNIYKIERNDEDSYDNLVQNGFFADVNEDGSIPFWLTNNYTEPAKCWDGAWGVGTQYMEWEHGDKPNETGADQWVGLLATARDTRYSLMQAVPVEVGSYYIFLGWTGGYEGDPYSGLYEMNDDGTAEIDINGANARYIKILQWSEDNATDENGNTIADEQAWYENVEVFKAETPYVGIRMSWNGDADGDHFESTSYTTSKFTGFQIYKLTAVDAVAPEDAPLGDGGVFVIKDNESGKYLGGGNSWGTQASLILEPQQFTLSLRPDGSYRISSYQYNYQNNSLFLADDGLYLDGEAAHWMIAEATDGYTISLYDPDDAANDGQFLANTSGSVVGLGTDALNWSIISQQDIIESMSEATKYDPVDVTAAFINNPSWNYKSNDTEVYWTFDDKNDSQSIENATGNNGFGTSGGEERCVEVYHSNIGFDFFQDLTGLPAGEYRLSVHGFYAFQGATDTGGYPYLYVNNGDYINETATFPELDADGQQYAIGSKSGAYEAFLDGEYLNEITFYVDGESNDMRIGVKGDNAEESLWNIFGLIKLEYLGNPLILHACEAEIDHWTTTGNNGHLVVNTWSGEGSSDGSGMYTPFIENWVTGETLTEANIYHVPFNSENVVLAPGTYWATVDARVYSEAGNALKANTVSLNVNRSRTDLVTDENATSTTYVTDQGTEQLVYGTYTCKGVIEIGSEDLSIYFQVDESNAEFNWLSWKNLEVLTYGFPTITKVEGMMNSKVQATMFGAVDAYNANNVQETYDHAVEAVEAAIESAAYYAGIAADVEKLDEAGLEAWLATASGAAYEAGSLTNEDVTADLAIAQKAQTTAGSDLTLALKYTESDIDNWTADQGNGPGICPSLNSAHETYNAAGNFTADDILYCTIDGLQHGWYTVSFYAQSNAANIDGIASGEGIAQAFANNSPAVDMTVGENTSLTWTDDDVMTIENVLVGEDGVLTFGITNTGVGGNWATVEGISLTLVLTADGLVERYITDCDETIHMLATFESTLKAMESEEGSKEYNNIKDAYDLLSEVYEEYGNLSVYTATEHELAVACAALESAMKVAEPLATEIEGITAEEGEDVIYTVTGVRVSKASQPGIYIINGKKVLVK